MKNLNILSLNVRGLRDGSKRRELFRWIKRYYNGDKHFVLLQETHSTLFDENIWQKEWGADIIFSHGTNDSKGVAILLPSCNSYKVETEKSWRDDNGRIALTRFKCEGESYTIINIYAPTKKFQKRQLDVLNTIIMENEDSSLILGGDFNTYLNPMLDRDN